ncbi:hypothetical protein EPUS_08654 [Endocarpon pusillum Z07020]|uniref:F-box domain-containing protein n=1 Tax=Endocarpon pusillum (strain Z07020 / HMAS-L-300199) TaxID=1263415 RepID=U1FTY1_ENDPU|nr:uncharacterized protein EPUS_08654 [Endocarpon pusillum Z07020]ERF68217.1 hypothetical protein EPUS_08654 [Endocarpon pusillum Z07020]
MRFNLLPMEIQLYILSLLDDNILVFLQRVHPYLDRLIGSLMTRLWDGWWTWKPPFKDLKVKHLDEHESGSDGTGEDDSETDDSENDDWGKEEGGEAEEAEQGRF